MDKRLVVVSGLGQRLVVDFGTLAVTTVDAPGDGYTYALFNKRAKKANENKPKPASAAAGEGKGEYPQPKPDIQASLVGGLPAEVNDTELHSFTTFHGLITLADLSEAFEKAAPGSTSYFVLGPKHGG